MLLFAYYADENLIRIGILAGTALLSGTDVYASMGYGSLISCNVIFQFK